MTAAPSASDGGDVGVGGGPMAVMEGAAVFFPVSSGRAASMVVGRRRSAAVVVGGGDSTRSGVTQRPAALRAAGGPRALTP